MKANGHFGPMRWPRIRIVGRATIISAFLFSERGNWTRPLPNFKRPWKSTPTMRKLTSTSATLSFERGNQTRPLPNFKRPWKSTPAMRKLTSTSATLSFERGNQTRPLPNFKRPWKSTPAMPKPTATSATFSFPGSGSRFPVNHPDFVDLPPIPEEEAAAIPSFVIVYNRNGIPATDRVGQYSGNRIWAGFLGRTDESKENLNRRLLLITTAP